ncbi:hypothetical protein BaRGS_00002273 [Batillaria attramentaria]|uniref:SOCS box domain-containing protein n=1 Tax=Batillaria attramentaria TaxID=370345 RepID=A0ABD0M4A4_9CAEN
MAAPAPGWRERRDAPDSKAAYEKRVKRRTIRKLQEAIDENDVSSVKEMLENEFDVDFRYRGQTALQLAVRLGTLDICQLLVARGASVDEADVESNSLLNVACLYGYQDIAKLLIENDANKEKENDEGFTPLHTCAKEGHASIARLLLTAKCNPNIPDRHGKTAVFVAAEEGQANVVEELVLAGADLDWVDQNHCTPLIKAAEAGHVDVVTELLKGGANCNLKDRRGHTALLEAAMRNHFEVVQLLLQYKADPNIPSTKEAVRNNNLKIAQLLLDAGCDINMADRGHQAPIHEAIRQVAQYFDPADSHAATGLVKRLVTAGADLNVPDSQGWRPIYQTAYGANFELSELMLKSGADLEVLTTTKDTVMHGAVYGNNLDIVNMLIKAGASVNGLNRDGQNPLMAGIISRSNIKILSALVEAGADLNQPESSALRTPLHEAIHQHYNLAAKLLIDSGCNLHAQNRERQTPLFLASFKGNEQIVRHLLAALPRPLKFTTLTAIPTHGAAKQGHAHVLQLLAEGGCDINQLNMDGLTPLQVAATEDNFPAARCLLWLGCDIDAHAKVTTLLKCCLLNEDPHPHFALEPLFLAMTHRNIDLMRLFIDCYTHVPLRVVKLLRAILKSSRELTVQFTPDMKRELLVMFDSSIRQPRLLQDLCRRTIRECLGVLPHLKVTTLPIGEKLKEYIVMKDVFEGWEASDRLDEEAKVNPAFSRWRAQAHESEDQGQSE